MALAVSDLILFTLVTLPVVPTLLLEPFCTSKSPSLSICTPEMLVLFYDPLMSFLSGAGIIVAFGGFVLLIPILILSLILSCVTRIRSYARGYRPTKTIEILFEVVCVIPVLLTVGILITILIAPEVF